MQIWEFVEVIFLRNPENIKTSFAFFHGEKRMGRDRGDEK